MPLVSFLMSNYKTPPAYLKRALDSMLAQTMPDFEAVIINDGVKDESYEVLLEYAAKDDRIRMIENEQNLGLAASLNRGIEACAGKYIARMDTDDICLPERLQLQTEYMESHPDVMFAGAWADVFDNDEFTLVNRFQPIMCQPQEYRIRLLFANSPLLIHPTVIFRSEFLSQNNLRYSEDPEYRYSEDYEMWTRCADCGTAGILQQVVLKYRNSISQSRITIRHKQEMELCAKKVQIKLFLRLGISAEEFCSAYDINLRFLDGRKPYDIQYKWWINKIIKQNKTTRVYDQELLKQLLYRQWYRTVYYSVIHEKSFFTRIKRAIHFYPVQIIQFFKDCMHRLKQKR